MDRGAWRATSTGLQRVRHSLATEQQIVTFNLPQLTRWTWVWVNSGSWWWTGRPGVLRFMGSQRVGHDWATELNWTEFFALHVYAKSDDHAWRQWSLKLCWYLKAIDFPGGSDSKASAYNAVDLGSIPGWGRSSGEGNGNLLQYSCLENPMDGRAW